MSISYTTIVQGQGVVLTLTLSASTFQGTESLAATVGTGGTDAALLTLTPSWSSGQTAGSYGRVDVTLTAADTASLSPGYYVLQVTMADDSAALAWVLLSVVASPGEDPAYSWLVQPSDVLGLVADLVTVRNLPDLPSVISAASDSIRRYCARWFTRKTWTTEYTPNVYGQVRLDEIPVNAISRIAQGRDNAMQVIGPSTAQLARVSCTTTGDYAGGLSVTGLTLTSVTSAVTTTTNLSFATYTTLGALQAAINAVAGWSASVYSGYSLWPTSELVGLTAAQGALNAGGCWLDVYTEDASLERMDADTGMIWLANRGVNYIDSPAWGPGWNQWTSNPRSPSRVKVTYDAGYDEIPRAVQLAAVETVQAMFSRLSTDQIIAGEKAADYSYTLKDQLDSLPDSVKHALAPYRIYNA